ncbi:MAG: DUF1653 domain-containing protein [Patescibacteria group bacterium]
MSHKPLNELAEEISAYKDHIEVGTTYVHYKDSTKTYIVRGVVVIEADDSIGVLYQAQYGPRLSFVRPVSEWLAIVDGKPRFSKVT